MAFSAGQRISASDLNDLLTPDTCIAARVAAQSVNNSTATALQFDTEYVDTNSMFTATSSKVYVQKAGVYIIQGYAEIASLGTSGAYIFELKRDGAAIASNDSPANSLGFGRGMVSTIDAAVVGSYYELIVFHTAGSAKNCTGRLSISWLSTTS